MRYIGREIATLFVRALQFAGHVIKGFGQPHELSWAGNWNARVEIAARYGIGGGHQIGQRDCDVARGTAPQLQHEQ